MKKLIWVNVKKYNPNIINFHINFIKKNMKSILPLDTLEKNKLATYANNNNIDKKMLYSMRNTLRTQKEIDCSRRFNRDKNNIIQLFSNMINNGDHDIQYFVKKSQMPYNWIIKLIKTLPEYDDLSLEELQYLENTKEKLLKIENKSKINSQIFETKLEKYLSKCGIEYRTEQDIIRDGDYPVTPDILFDKPIDIIVDGKVHTIAWMDAKNYILINVPFIIRSLKKQASKYNDYFGEGAFVYHYGFDNSIKIPGVIMLDGSIL